MRKKTIAYGIDKLMWYIVYLFPVLLLLLACICTPLADVISTANSSAFVTDFGNTDIYKALNDVFGANGLVPLLSGETGNLILSYATYLVIILIVHLAVDFLAFVPKFAHKMFDRLLGGARNDE